MSPDCPTIVGCFKFRPVAKQKRHDQPVIYRSVGGGVVMDSYLYQMYLHVRVFDSNSNSAHRFFNQNRYPLISRASRSTLSRRLQEAVCDMNRRAEEGSEDYGDKGDR